MASSESGSDDEYIVPFVGPSAYRSGLKKKGVKFVAAGQLESTFTPEQQQHVSGDDIAAQYLALVMGKTSQGQTQEEASSACCEVCRLPLSGDEKHESSLAHQVCLAHTHPPNSIDRRRKGVTYLQTYGWDPDSRLGLGATGEGIRHPIQPKEKTDKAGLGDKSREVTPKDAVAKKVKKTPQGLDPRGLKRLEAQNKSRDQRLHDMFYTDDRVARYLGEGA